MIPFYALCYKHLLIVLVDTVCKVVCKLIMIYFKVSNSISCTIYLMCRILHHYWSGGWYVLTCVRHMTSKNGFYGHSLFPGYELTVTDNCWVCLSNVPYPKNLDIQNMCRNPLRAQFIGPNTILAHCTLPHDQRLLDNCLL